MKLGTKNHACVGKRVQIPAYADLWMRGARFGTVERVVIGTGNYVQAHDPRGGDMFAEQWSAATILDAAKELLTWEMEQ